MQRSDEGEVEKLSTFSHGGRCFFCVSSQRALFSVRPARVPQEVASRGGGTRRGPEQLQRGAFLLSRLRRSSMSEARRAAPHDDPSFAKFAQLMESLARQTVPSRVFLTQRGAWRFGKFDLLSESRKQKLRDRMKAAVWEEIRAEARALGSPAFAVHEGDLKRVQEMVNEADKNKAALRRGGGGSALSGEEAGRLALLDEELRRAKWVYHTDKLQRASVVDEADLRLQKKFGAELKKLPVAGDGNCMLHSVIAWMFSLAWQSDSRARVFENLFHSMHGAHQRLLRAVHVLESAGGRAAARSAPVVGRWADFVGRRLEEWRSAQAEDEEAAAFNAAPEFVHRGADLLRVCLYSFLMDDTSPSRISSPDIGPMDFSSTRRWAASWTLNLVRVLNSDVRDLPEKFIIQDFVRGKDDGALESSPMSELERANALMRALSQIPGPGAGSGAGARLFLNEVDSVAVSAVLGVGVRIVSHVRRPPQAPLLLRRGETDVLGSRESHAGFLGRARLRRREPGQSLFAHSHALAPPGAVVDESRRPLSIVLKHNGSHFETLCERELHLPLRQGVRTIGELQVSSAASRKTLCTSWLSEALSRTAVPLAGFREQFAQFGEGVLSDLDRVLVDFASRSPPLVRLQSFEGDEDEEEGEEGGGGGARGGGGGGEGEPKDDARHIAGLDALLVTFWLASTSEQRGSSERALQARRLAAGVIRFIFCVCFNIQLQVRGTVTVWGSETMDTVLCPGVTRELLLTKPVAFAQSIWTHMNSLVARQAPPNQDRGSRKRKASSRSADPVPARHPPLPRSPR